MEIAAFVIAVVGLGISLYNFIKDLYTSHIRLSANCRCILYDGGKAFFALDFVNGSKLPVSITRAECCLDRKDINLGKTALTWYTYNHPELHGYATENTTLLPLEIGPYSFQSVTFFCNGYPAFTESRVFDLNLGTNRGKVRIPVHVEETTDDPLLFLQYSV